MWQRLSSFIFGPPVHGQLPQRVRASIAAHQIQSEKLIAWCQLLVVGFFLALYTVAPKTSEGTPFQPVPFVLACYLVFTTIRLWLVYRHALPRWFLVISVVSDVVLLMVLIWSFHLQYEQPAPFYLKAPTLLYVFIFISARTLRYEPFYVLITGLTAAVTWLALVWFALNDMPSIGGAITRDYVDYMTSNRILIGAEVDKVISILLVTVVLAVAQVRARRMLIQAVISGTAAGDLSRFVSREIAEQVTAADRPVQPGDGDIRTATILFCDIAGFSTIAEQVGPQEVMKTLNDYLASVSAVIHHYGGVITEFRGDAMLITFNAATDDPEHAANALRTAIGIQAVVDSHLFGPNIAMPTRCGINTGEVIAGVVGTAERVLATVHGDEVNIAARLEQLNKQYETQILASESTVLTAGGGFAVKPIGSVTVRGRKTPVTVYEVKGSVPDAQMLAAGR